MAVRRFAVFALKELEGNRHGGSHQLFAGAGESLWLAVRWWVLDLIHYVLDRLFEC